MLASSVAHWTGIRTLDCIGFAQICRIHEKEYISFILITLKPFSKRTIRTYLECDQIFQHLAI